MQKTLQTFLQPKEGGLSRLEVLEGPTGRRTWSDEVKARIVAETLTPGVKVFEVAGRHRVAPQSLTTWRRLAREGRLTLVADRSCRWLSPMRQRSARRSARRAAHFATSSAESNSLGLVFLTCSWFRDISGVM